jgi:hypothetical protein
MCTPAEVIDAYGESVARTFGIPYVYNRPGPGGVYLGSVGDQAHSVRASSHNCASAPGGQESGPYHPGHAHAWDARPANTEIGYEMVRQTLMDDRVRYVLYADHGWYPDGTFEDITDNEQWDLDHDTFHVSMKPGTHDDTRPFFTEGDELVGETADKILNHVEDIDRKMPGREQQQRDRAKATATGRLVRSNADLLVEIAEAVNADKKIDAATLRVARSNRDKLALLLDGEDEDGAPTEDDG